MDRGILDVVSNTVVDSWFRNGYLLGPGSRSAYRDLGVLMLREWGRNLKKDSGSSEEFFRGAAINGLGHAVGRHKDPIHL